MKISLVLTAAGLSSRFGGDKLLTDTSGEPLGIRSMRLYALPCLSGRILVTSSSRQYLIDEAEKYGYRVILNPAPEKGLSGSVRLGLEAACINGEPDGILFAAADMPFLRQQTIEMLAEAFQASPSQIVAPGPDACSPRKPVIFPRSLFHELRQIGGDTGGRSVLRAHKALVTVLPVPEEELRDIDTKEDISFA